MNAAQQRRLRQLRSRLLVRAFDHRQRRHARGVWFRLRRVLTFAKEAHAARITSAHRVAVRLDAETLAAECLALVPFEAGAGTPR